MTPEHTITPTLKELAEELARVKAERDERWTHEQVWTAIEDMGTQFTELFEREAQNIEDAHEGNKVRPFHPMDPRMIGRKEAYEACALAMIKGTTRKMIVWPSVEIKFTVPSEAKP